MSEATVDTHDPRPHSNESSLAAIVYALFIAGLFLGFIPSLIGVIIAHAAANSRDDLMRSHFKYQIRTFWIGFAIFAISVIALGLGFGKMIETGLKTVDKSVQVTEITTPDNSTDMDGGTQMEDAVERACVATRQYAKRQRTWFRHQFLSNLRITEKFSESDFSKNFPEIRNRVLTPAD